MSGPRAVTLTRISKTFDEGIASLTLSPLPSPSPLLSSQVRVRVVCSALNYFDLLILTNSYQMKPSLPFVMGSEWSGIITEVGTDVTNFRVRDEVFAGMTMGGGMSDEVVCDVEHVLKKPPLLSFAQTASLPVAFYTNYHALVQRGHLQRGEYLLVTGAAGGMGLHCIQLGVKLGARVIALASSPSKLSKCKDAGAEFLIDSSKDNIRKSIEKYTDGHMVDVCYEVVGGDVFDQCSRLISPGGRLLVVGFASGSIPKMAVNLVLVKGYSLVGVRSGAEMAIQPEVHFEMDRKMMEWIADETKESEVKKLAPFVYKEYSVGDFKDAFTCVANRSVVGKSVIVWNEKENERSKRSSNIRSKM